MRGGWGSYMKAREILIEWQILLQVLVGVRPHVVTSRAVEV